MDFVEALGLTLPLILLLRAHEVIQGCHALHVGCCSTAPPTIQFCVAHIQGCRSLLVLYA
jgi:hypothetical protein